MFLFMDSWVGSSELAKCSRQVLSEAPKGRAPPSCMCKWSRCIAHWRARKSPTAPTHPSFNGAENGCATTIRIDKDRLKDVAHAPQHAEGGVQTSQVMRRWRCNRPATERWPEKSTPLPVATLRKIGTCNSKTNAPVTPSQQAMRKNPIAQATKLPTIM